MSGACEVADTDEHNEDEAFFEEVNCHRDYHIQQSLSGSSSDKLASYNALIQHEDDVAAESPDTGPNGGAYAETFTRSIEGDVAKTIGDERSLGCTGLHSSKDDSIARSPRTLPHSLPPAGGSEEVFEKQDSRGGHVSERSSRSRVHISLASEFRESQATRDIHLLDNRAERENDTCSGLFSLNLDKAFAQRLRTLNIQRGTEAPDEDVDLVPVAGEDLMQHVQRLSTRIQTQEAEKRTMAEESFQLEQLLKRKYHEDISAKTRECKELQRHNATLMRQLQITQTECQELRQAFSEVDGVIDGIVFRSVRALDHSPPDETDEGYPLPESTARIVSLCEVLRGAYKSQCLSKHSDGANALRNMVDRMLLDCRDTLNSSKSSSGTKPVLDLDNKSAATKTALAPTQAFSAIDEPATCVVGSQVRSNTLATEFGPEKSFMTPAGSSTKHVSSPHHNDATENASHAVDGVFRGSSSACRTRVATLEEFESKKPSYTDDKLSGASIITPAKNCRELDDFTFLDTHFPEIVDSKKVQSVERKHDSLPGEKVQKNRTPAGRSTFSEQCSIYSPHAPIYKSDGNASVCCAGNAEFVDKFYSVQKDLDTKNFAPATKPLWKITDRREKVPEVGISSQPNHVLPARQKVRKRNVTQGCPSSTLPWSSCILGRACSVGSLHADSTSKIPLPSSEGIKLPPLHQRKRTDAEAFQRGGRRRSSSLTVSASAKSLLPVLRPKDRGHEGVLPHGFGGASGDLSVVGRTLVPGRLCCGRTYLVGHQIKAGGGPPALSASPHSPADLSRTISANRSVSTNPKRVFSRTRRSVSPVERRDRPELRCITSESLRIESRIKIAGDGDFIGDDSALRQSRIPCNQVGILNQNGPQSRNSLQQQDDGLKRHWSSGYCVPSHDLGGGNRAGDAGNRGNLQPQSLLSQSIKVNNLVKQGRNGGDQSMCSPSWPVFVMNPDGCSVQGRCSDYAALMSREDCGSSPVGIFGASNERRAPTMLSVLSSLGKKEGQSPCATHVTDDAGYRTSLLSGEGIHRSNGAQMRPRWCLSPGCMPEDLSGSTPLGRSDIEVDKKGAMRCVTPISIALRDSPPSGSALPHTVQSHMSRYSGDDAPHSLKVRSVCPELPDMRSAHVRP